MTLTRDEAEARVRLGAELLDDKRPGWFQRIDTDRLRIDSCYHCVIAQLTDGQHTFPFTIGLTQLGVTHASPFGFGIDEKGGRLAEDAAFALLQDAWIDAIAARKFPVLASADARTTTAVDPSAQIREGDLRATDLLLRTE